MLAEAENIVRNVSIRMDGDMCLRSISVHRNESVLLNNVTPRYLNHDHQD